MHYCSCFGHRTHYCSSLLLHTLFPVSHVGLLLSLLTCALPSGEKREKRNMFILRYGHSVLYTFESLYLVVFFSVLLAIAVSESRFPSSWQLDINECGEIVNESVIAIQRFLPIRYFTSKHLLSYFKRYNIVEYRRSWLVSDRDAPTTTTTIHNVTSTQNDFFRSACHSEGFYCQVA